MARGRRPLLLGILGLAALVVALLVAPTLPATGAASACAGCPANPVQQFQISAAAGRAHNAAGSADRMSFQLIGLPCSSFFGNPLTPRCLNACNVAIIIRCKIM